MKINTGLQVKIHFHPECYSCSEMLIHVCIHVHVRDILTLVLAKRNFRHFCVGVGGIHPEGRKFVGRKFSCLEPNIRNIAIDISQCR